VANGDATVSIHEKLFGQPLFLNNKGCTANTCTAFII